MATEKSLKAAAAEALEGNGGPNGIGSPLKSRSYILNLAVDTLRPYVCIYR